MIDVEAPAVFGSLAWAAPGGKEETMELQIMVPWEGEIIHWSVKDLSEFRVAVDANGGWASIIASNPFCRVQGLDGAWRDEYLQALLGDGYIASPPEALWPTACPGHAVEFLYSAVAAWTPRPACNSGRKWGWLVPTIQLGVLSIWLSAFDGLRASWGTRSAYRLPL